MPGAQCRQQVILGDVGVALRRGDRCVSEHLLDDTDVRAEPKQQRCHRVPDHVRRHRDRDSRGSRNFSENTRDPLRRQALPARVQEECRLFRPKRPTRRNVCRDGAQRPFVG